MEFTPDGFYFLTKVGAYQDCLMMQIEMKV